MLAAVARSTAVSSAASASSAVASSSSISSMSATVSADRSGWLIRACAPSRWTMVSASVRSRRGEPALERHVDRRGRRGEAALEDHEREADDQAALALAFGLDLLGAVHLLADVGRDLLVQVGLGPERSYGTTYA